MTKNYYWECPICEITEFTIHSWDARLKATKHEKTHKSKQPVTNVGYLSEEIKDNKNFLREFIDIKTNKKYIAYSKEFFEYLHERNPNGVTSPETYFNYDWLRYISYIRSKINSIEVDRGIRYQTFAYISGAPNTFPARPRISKVYSSEYKKVTDKYYSRYVYIEFNFTDKKYGESKMNTEMIKLAKKLMEEPRMKLSKGYPRIKLFPAGHRYEGEVCGAYAKEIILEPNGMYLPDLRNAKDREALLDYLSIMEAKEELVREFEGLHLKLIREEEASLSKKSTVSDLKSSDPANWDDKPAKNWEAGEY